MKLLNNILSLFSLIVLSLIVITSGCVETITNNPDDDPTITVFSPEDGDTIGVGQNPISYTASDYVGGQGLSRYEVFVNGSSNGVYEVSDDGSATALYIVTDTIAIGARINYTVTVYNEEGNFATSDTKEDILILLTVSPPPKPANLTLQKTSPTQALLIWDDTSSTESSYEVWRRAGTNSYQRITTLDANTVTYTDDGISQFIDYFYKVRAVNEFGNSAFSNEASTASPSNLTATAQGATTVQLEWVDNSQNESSFRIERSTDEGETWDILSFVNPNTTEYTDNENLTKNTTYFYRVGAVYTSFTAYSKTVSVETFNQDIPAPQSLVASYNSTTRVVDVTWTDATVQENGTYVERKQGVNGTYEQIATTAQDVSSYSDSDVEIQKIYYYRARHSTTEGFFTPYSNEDTVFVPDLPPAAPSNLVIFEKDPLEYGLVWEDNAEDEDGFEVWRRDGQSQDFQLLKQITTPDVISTTVNIPNPNLTYGFKVRAYRGTVYSNFSNIVTTDSGSETILLEEDVVTTDFVRIKWNEAYPNAIGYEVERRQFGDLNFTLKATVGSLDYTDNSVFKGTTYEYRVRAIFETGKSEYSNTLTVQVPDE